MVSTGNKESAPPDSNTMLSKQFCLKVLCCCLGKWMESKNLTYLKLAEECESSESVEMMLSTVVLKTLVLGALAKCWQAGGFFWSFYYVLEKQAALFFRLISKASKPLVWQLKRSGRGNFKEPLLLCACVSFQHSSGFVKLWPWRGKCSSWVWITKFLTSNFLRCGL